MSYQQYMDSLNKITEACGNNEADVFWMKAKDVLNLYLKEAFLSNLKNKDLVIALDDNKMHCRTTNGKKTFGFQQVRCIKANRFGHTMHTAGYSATGSLLCAMLEREEETTTNVYECMIQKMFG